MKRPCLLVPFIVLAGLALAACVVPVAPSAPPATPASIPTPEPRPFVTWYQYDQGNEDPKSNERVGNEWLRKVIPQFDTEFAGKWVWDNRYTPWDKLAATLIAAVQAKGEVPDLIEINTSSVNQYYTNAALQDLTDWAKAQSWWADMDPVAIQTCTAPDGKLLCIPMATRPYFVYVWKDRFPNGFPQTPEQFLAEGERLQKDGLYAMTFLGSTDYNGAGALRGVWMTISSFGGTYDDGQGNMRLNTPENVAAIAWLRDMVQKGYVPEIAFAGGFQEEEAFKNSSAGALPSGLFGYRYLNPLQAPNGNEYKKKNEQDVLDAVAAGDLMLAPMVAPAGNKPGCDVSAMGLGIPVGAKNPQAAYDHINWLLNPAQNPDFVLGPGAGFPALKSMQSNPQFRTPFYKQAAAVLNASACRRWFGSLLDTAGAQETIMAVVYKLIKEDPTADIATELQKAQDEFNEQ